MATKLSTFATTLKALHVPGKPVVFANVYDYPSAQAVAALPASRALATASYAIATAAGLTDDDLTLETNLAAARLIGRAAREHGKPLTVDLQDGYGARLEEAVAGIIDAGAVGINLEDFDRETNAFFPIDKAVARVETVLRVAKQHDVPDFVVNARCDILVHGGSLEDTIARGKAYLDAGATSVFVWGGSQRGVARAEVAELVKAFQGRLSVSLNLGVPGALGVSELAKIGVSRISVGPRIQKAATQYYAEVANALLTQE